MCDRPQAGRAQCHVHVLEASDGVTPDASTSPTGLAPAVVKSVYNFPTSATAGTGQTIAIVDAYDNPTVASDLATFSAQYGLPCNSCLTKVNQSGGTNYPTTDGAWALEISLDVQWAHAVAPGANLLLVEARSTSLTDLFAAETYAANHANYVSNSWGGSEFSYESAYDSNFSKAGVSFFVASGDSGLGAEYPSASPNVISVGGTQLNNIGTPNFFESAWSGGGGGCSAYETALAAQSGFSQYSHVNCAGKRATPDVALDAAPNSGVSVYDSTYYLGQKGWFTVGGTSASSPMWAARSAIEGAVVNAGYVYGNNITFRDITTGSNGAAATTGYDLATGRGSWITSVPAPGAPTLNTATGGVNSVALTWSGPTTGGAAASYNVYRSGASGPVSLVTSGVTGTSFTDTVTPGTYTYQITAVNSSGVEGPPSNQLSATATAPPPLVPGPPALNTASGGVGSVALNWSAPSTGGTATSYNIYRGTSSGSETEVTSGVTATSYTDNVAAGTYFYQVTAANGSGEGARSNELSATSSQPPPTPPGPPHLATATGGVGSVTLSWTAPTTGGAVSTYRVYRGASAGSETLLASGLTATSFTDNPSPGTYFYEVTAVNGGGEGARSNELSATATTPPDDLPTVSFTRSCTFSACTFTSTAGDPDGSISKYLWSGGNNLTGSSYRVTHGYTTSGTFAVNVTVTDSSGQQGTASGTVTCATDSSRRLVCG